MLHLHILGISGTFMSALALLAKSLGYKVTGSDAHCYPPISNLLTDQGIVWTEGYEDTTLALDADCVLVGNAIKRGMPVLEAVLNARRPYLSGPQWLAEQVLHDRRVIAVAGTHGKTTTTSMIAWILQEAGLNPGFLIGGVASNFNTSAKLGDGDWFVIEADEYDSAFFDKRPKFMHYRPEIALVNNLEFDHADIYPDLAAIQQQFHYLMRTIPSKGILIAPAEDKALQAVVARGLYSDSQYWSVGQDAQWSAQLLDDSASSFTVFRRGQAVAEVEWPLIGKFNVANGLAALIASVHAGVDPEQAAEALGSFKPVKRRLEVVVQAKGITVYDDFAHHPTAIRATLDAVLNSQRHKRIFVIMEFASYTMRTGVHAKALPAALAGVQGVYLLEPEAFSLTETLSNWTCPYSLFTSTQDIVQAISQELQPGDAVVVMSNKGFGGIYQQLRQAIARS